jgi:RHS repeat-associated protein
MPAWGSLTQAQFSSYSAIILGDPTCSTSASTAIGAAVTDVSTWSPAITGNVVVAGASPVAAAGGANPQGASTVTKDTVAYALASGSGKTGLYVSLSCYYAASGSGTSVPVLGGLGTFTVGGGVAATDAGTVNVPVDDGAPAFRGLTNAGLLGWSASVQETFGSWPASYQALAVDNSATPSDFTGPDGLTGRPYVLVNNAPTPSSFAGAVQGVVPTSATYGATDDASPGVSQGITTAGSGVNPANGDFTSQASDASAATYGPALALSRTYDSKLAQAESTTGTPGAFGYGWSSDFGNYLGLHSPTTNDIYTAQSTGLSHPQNEAMDSAGNLYIADTGNNRVEEVPASSHTQWGIAMTAGTKYVIAGSSSGTAGSSGNGGAATSALLSAPTDVATDANGDLYIADSINDRIQELAASTGTQWGTSMTANDIYSVLGTTGTSGCSGNAHVASTANINTPTGIAVDGSGNLYVADEANNRILVLPKATGTYWGISMTGGSEYTVVGHSTCTSGISGDGAVATGAHLASPYGVSLDAAGDLLVADSGNQRIQEVPVASGTQWGIAMTAAFMYTIAGNASGSTGHSGDGGVATSALLNNPTGTAVDSVGDLYITDSANNRIQEVAQTTRTQWGTAMTANDIYTVAGSSTGTSGSTGDGGAATAALLANPEGIAVDSSGNLYVGDTTNSSIREMVATSPSTWALSPTPSGITVNQGSGAQVTFIPPVSGACPSPYIGPGTTGTYCAAPYVTATLSYNSGTSTYTLVDHPYAVSTFSSTGQLTGESMAGGAALTMAYGTPAPGSGNCPATATSCNTVTSASGRTLTIGLNASSLVTSVTDPLGNKWAYAYTSGNLTSVTDPMSRVTSYSYDTTNSNPTLVHDLLTLTAPNGQTGGSHAGAKLTNAYNGSGMVTSQVDPQSRTTTINYGAMNTGTGNGDTVVTDPDGNQNEHLFSTGILDASIVGYGSSVPSGTYYTLSTTTLLPSSVIDPDGGVTAITYDSSGNVLTSTDQLGRVSTNTYNGFDEMTCSTKALSASPCSSLSPPSAVSPGGTITPPSAPPAFVTYTLYDTSGNQLYQTQGVYQPGAGTASYSQTSYSLHQGNSVTLGTTNDTCGATPPSTSLPCATIDANANVTQLVYNSSGDVTSSAIPDGNGTELATTTNAYDADGNQTSTTAPAGNVSGATAANYTTTTTYDADHEALVSTLARGTGSTITPTVNATYYDPNGNRVATTGPLGNPYGTANPTGCNPISTSTCSDTTYNTFDADNEQTLGQDPSGNQTLTCFDGDGNQAQTVPPWGVANNSLTSASCPTAYPAGYSSTPLATDATMTTYNAQGKSIVVTVPPSTTGSSRVTTTNTYDPASQLIETVAPPSTGTGGTNQVTTTTFDLAGQTTTMTTGFGTSSAATTSNCYDPDGNQTATVPGTGNASGLVACGTTSPWTSSSSYQSTSSYDSAGEVVGTVSPPPAGQTANATTSTTYDPNGNVLTSTDANSVVTTNAYNPLNKLVSSIVSGANNTNYYDANGNLLATTAPGGNPYSPSNPTGCNPLTTANCAYATYNTYNSSNELLTSTNPDQELTTYYWDQNGNKVAMTGPAGNPATCNPTTSSTPCVDSITWVYNNLGQITCMGQKNGANNTCASPGTGAGITTYTYTADGQRATMVDATGTTHYYYDASDRVTSTVNGAGATVTYGYAQNSDENCVSYPNASNDTCTTPGTGLGVVTYGYNTANQLTSVGDWAGNTLAYSYNANGSVSNLSANSGAVGVATGYDSAGNVSSINATAFSGATALLDLTYTRQPNGFIASEVPQVGSTTMGTKSYGYNGLNQVTSGPIKGTTGSTAYSYQPGGYIAQSTNIFGSAKYHQAGEVCWTYSGTSSNTCTNPPTNSTTYNWNASGQRAQTVATAATQTYGWNEAMGTLTCVNTSGTTCSTSSPTSTTTVNTYNSDNLRTSSALGGGTATNFTWDTTTQIPRDLSDGTWDYVYLPGSNVPVEQVGASGASPAADLLLTDANSNVRGLVQLTSGTHQKQLVNYTDYDAYGNPITQSGGSAEAGGLTATHTGINSNYVATTPFGFGGGYTDAASGLIYLVNRWFDSATAQFMSIDPALSQTQQPYEYAGDNPANQVDPSGMCSFWNPFCLIDSVAWRYIYPGWTLTVNVSSWARFLFWVNEPGSQLLVWSAWHTTVDMARPSAPRNVRVDTTTMFDQFVCHWVTVRAEPWRPFHLDVWRPAVGFWQELRARCNPV